MEVLEPRAVSEQPSGGDPAALQGRPLEVFTGERRGPSAVMAEALRCQVKISTSRSLHLRIANHTARDVYVRLVGQGGCIAATSVGLERHSLEQNKEGITTRFIVSYVGINTGHVVYFHKLKYFIQLHFCLWAFC